MSLPHELEEIKSLPQWVCYQNQWNERKQKNSKIPKNPATGYGAKANDPATWATYAEAVAAARRFNFDGVGFEFAAGYMGIDLDNVIGADGKINAVAAEIVATIDSYTEYSPSGKGLHILCKCPGANPIGSRNDAIGLEMYNNGRFFTVTGKPYGAAKPIQERTEQVKAVYMEYLYKPPKEQPKAQTCTGSIPMGSYRDTGTDADLWQKMFNSAKGREIQALYSGDISGHDNDHSRADQALANHLAYWTNNDAARIDRMFRQSGLMRPKWEQKRGAQTYGERTIAAAIANTPTYTPPVRATAQEDFAEQEREVAPVQPAREIAPAQSAQGKKPPENIREYIYHSLKGDLERFQSFKDRKTGFRNIDEITSLYPGLYVLGAISSLGKTTFAHQLGDQLAKAGDHVLYFSLEQTRLEMVTKGLARITAQKSFETAVSAIDIRRGNITDAVKEAVKTYADFAEHETVIECSFDTTIDTITGTVKDYIKQTGTKPVVIVDYLQIIRPIDPKQNTKDAVDGHVRALKKLQTDNDLVLLVISSLNRQNYLTPVDFESFKESGGIEYTADVIWGLQLQIMNGDLFDKKDKLKEKREKVKAAKLENPRKIELVCLKNRYGKSSYFCGFNYYPQFDYFIPQTDFDGFTLLPDDEEIPFRV